jgi:hypothetical protein
VDSDADLPQQTIGAASILLVEPCSGQDGVTFRPEDVIGLLALGA